MGDLRNKQLYERYYFVPMLISLIPTIVVIVLQVLLFIKGIGYAGYFLIVTGLCIAMFGDSLFLLIREVSLEKYLMEHGTIVNGSAVSAGMKLTGIIMVTKYEDAETKKTYKYKTTTTYVMDPVRLQQFIENSPDIRIIVDLKNPRKGMALIEEYCIMNEIKYKDEILPELDFFKRRRK